jgi:hypothetical protein
MEYPKPEKMVVGRAQGLSSVAIHKSMHSVDRLSAAPTSGSGAAGERAVSGARL